MDGLLYLVACFVFLILVLYWLGTYNYAVIESFNVPGSKPWPFVGNIPDIVRYGRKRKLLLEYRKRYGNVFYVCFGQKPFIVVADPELIKLITVKEFEKFRNRTLTKMPPPNHVGIGIAQDEDWKRIRSTLTPTFSGAKMKMIAPLVQESCNVLISKFLDAADSGETVNAKSFIQQYVLDVLMSSAFGMETNSQLQKEPNSELFRKIMAIFKNRSNIQIAIQCLPFHESIMSLLAWAHRIGTPLQYLNDIAYQIIEQRKKRGIDIGRKDLMHLMLTTTDNEGKRKLSDDEISAQSVALLMAGLHSTSEVLSMCLYYLALFPDLQENLYTEIQSALQADPEKLMYDVIHEIKYLDCFLNELLRFVVRDEGQITRTCSQTCTLNGIHFPAGTGVIISYYLAHFDSNAWDEPGKFDPERFRGPAKDQLHPYQFNPFGVGPRSCLAMRFAQMEIRITIVRLLKDLKFILSPEAMSVSDSSDTFRPDSVELRVERRRQK